MVLLLILILMVQHCIVASQTCLQVLSTDCTCHGSNQIIIKCNFSTQSQLKIINDVQSVSLNITTLDLSGNNLSSLPGDIFSGIYSIQQLDLSLNNFENLDYVSYPNIGSKITNLNLSYNSLTQIDDSTFSTMPALERLDISNNQINTIGDNTFVNNHFLWYVDLSQNSINSLSTATFNGIENSLVTLDLSGNSLSTVDSETFSFLHDLKYLNLSNNSNTAGLADVKFPGHVILIDLKNSGIEHFDDCLLLNLVDLEYVNLQDNPLKCSCHLSWFLQKLIYKQKTDTIHVHQGKNNDWTCKLENGSTILVANLQTECSDQYLLKAPEHCKKSSDSRGSPNPNTIILSDKLNLATKKGDNEVFLTWQRYNYSDFYGYEIIILGEEGQIVYSSPKLHPSVSQYTAKSDELKSGKYQVCLNVLHNETHVLGNACKEISYLDLQIVVGILAGVIFLIPCIVALAYIMCLDKRKFMFNDTYSEISHNNEENNLEKQATTKSDQNPKESTAKWNKETLKVPSIKVQDLSSTGNTKHQTLTEARSTDRILPDNTSSSNVSIEPDGDSGSSAGIRIDIPSDNDDQGSVNQGYIEEKTCDVKL